MRVALFGRCAGPANNGLFGLQRAQDALPPANMNKVDDSSQTAQLELAQCHIRVFVALPILIGWFLFWSMQARSHDANTGLVGLCVFYAFALAQWAHVKRYPGDRPLRRVVAIAMDQLGCFVGMLLTRELGTVIVFLNLWISLGNGIRFGVRWMALSAALAVIGLIALGAVSEYWSRHPIWIISLILLNTAIPAYVASLIQGFHDGRTRLAQYADHMEKMALKDALTGLPNRSALFDEFEKASAYARRMGSAIAVLYFDLDGFKRVNDTLGHAQGDMLLKETAGRANAVLRGEDVLARFGGDEFVVLLRVHDSGKRARSVAERIRQSIASIGYIDGNPVEVTVSVGIVVVNGPDAARLGAEQIVHEADLNMYAAKKYGKNQIVLTTLSSEIRLVARQA